MATGGEENGEFCAAVGRATGTPGAYWLKAQDIKLSRSHDSCGTRFIGFNPGRKMNTHAIAVLTSLTLPPPYTLYTLLPYKFQSPTASTI